MTIDRVIDPKNPEDDSDIVTCALTELLRNTTLGFINGLKDDKTPFTPEQFNGIYNAAMNYFHQTLDLLVHCIDGTKDQLGFIKAADAGFHHIMNHLLEDIGEQVTKH